jgi:hypothetical protein
MRACMPCRPSRSHSKYSGAKTTRYEVRSYNIKPYDLNTQCLCFLNVSEILRASFLQFHIPCFLVNGNVLLGQSMGPWTPIKTQWIILMSNGCPIACSLLSNSNTIPKYSTACRQFLEYLHWCFDLWFEGIADFYVYLFLLYKLPADPVLMNKICIWIFF